VTGVTVQGKLDKLNDKMFIEEKRVAFFNVPKTVKNNNKF
jgi:hypothetical protein